MGMFSSGSAKRAAEVQATAMRNAQINLEKGVAEALPYYDPYVQAGQQATQQQQAALDTAQQQISALDPRFDAMYGQVAALQPQVDEMYGLSQQVDPIVQDILSGGQGFEESVGYDFRFDQGQRALESSQAASGMLDSGSTGKALVEYGQGVASDEFDKYMNRQYQAVNTVGAQLGGRQQALGAGQSQVTSGLNIAGQELNQITAQQNQAAQYNQLIAQGYSASDAQAKLEMEATRGQVASNLGQGNAYSQGMMAKDAELKNQGAALIQLAATAAGGAMGGGMGGAMMGAQIGGGLGGLTGGSGMSPQIMPMGNTQYATPTYSQTPVLQGVDIGNQMPWLKDDNMATQAQVGSKSTYGGRYI